jgi:hypothetical protein
MNDAIKFTALNHPCSHFMRSLFLAMLTCFFRPTISNAMHAGGLRGEFLDIMGRKIIETHHYSTEKATYLDIIRRDQVSTLIREVAHELGNFDMREYFTAYEQVTTLKNITTLCNELEVFLQRTAYGLHTPMYVYPLHAQLVYAMEKQLSEFYVKIGGCRIEKKQTAA